jgi:hypothetical protein
MNRRRLRSFILAFIPQLGIGLHQSRITERVFYLHLWLSRDVYTRLHNNLHDEAAKRKFCSVLISSLQHNVEDMLAQTKGQSHDNGI